MNNARRWRYRFVNSINNTTSVVVRVIAEGTVMNNQPYCSMLPVLSMSCIVSLIGTVVAVLLVDDNDDDDQHHHHVAYII